MRGLAGPLAGVARYTAHVLSRLGYRSRARLTPVIGRHFRFVNDSCNRAQVGWYGRIANFLTPFGFFEYAFTCRR